MVASLRVRQLERELVDLGVENKNIRMVADSVIKLSKRLKSDNKVLCKVVGAAIEMLDDMDGSICEDEWSSSVLRESIDEFIEMKGAKDGWLGITDEHLMGECKAGELPEVKDGE